ncbi:MAG TPA: Holliday junction branch migration protein RuvA [Candidatus Desulfofervidus auxilii]|uniref:Holliday junction branch migration complex subunit RuvA n=1 Tax=Desulfofervidus auxilii TaxID=1621989 RepID=A0A7V0NEF1_DESA2|nr:Holliday junction branch migration protein RuvA [Candidatus Desulfofervidus auxilii]
MSFESFISMIGYLEGILFLKQPQYIVILIDGVGYQIEVSLNTFSELPREGEKISLHIYTYVKDNVLKLYGFNSLEEKRLFSTLIEIPGIGPKLALNILSRISPLEFKEILDKADLKRLKAIPGIGKKAAQRIWLELKDKRITPPQMVQAGEKGGTLKEDAISALINLGYQRQEASKAVDKAMSKFSKLPTLEDLIKETLRQL